MYLFPQEKLYVQTDKPYYISGEIVFFRTFLLNAFSHKPVDFSRYVYIELVNPLDSVVIRQQIRPENDLFYGTISIPEDLVQGNYLLRAYTRFMINLPEDYFFSKPLRIYDPISMKIETKAEFEFIKENQVDIHLQFSDTKTEEVLHPERISIRLNDEKPRQYKLDKDGFLHIKQDLAENSDKRILFVEFHMEDRVFKDYLYIPYPENKLEVMFYPEGGSLIAGKPNQIAFKALKSDGTSADIRGAVYDSNDNQLVEFSTLHEGMGSFFLETVSGEKYHAICKMENQTFRVDLPDPKTDVYGLKIQSRQNKLGISVNKPESLPWRKLYLFIHSRGNALYFEEWDSSKDFIVMDKSTFPSGVSHILLLTEDFHALSERLVFSLSDDWISAAIQTNKEIYAKRERVKMDIQLQKNDENGGSFAVSVTDDKDIAADTTRNILSEILLISELRGHIANPAYYFEQNDKRTELAADLLMLTHGWTRYDIPKALRGDFQYLTVPNEEAQSFSGLVKGGLLSKPYSGGKVSILSTNATFFDLAETDENGRFEFKHFEYPDSTQYIIQALNKKGKDVVELYLDSIIYPEINNVWKSIEKESSKERLNDYIEKADLKYTYENGRRVILLPEVTVRKRVEKERKYRSPYYLEPNNSFSREEIERMGSSDIGTLISRIPGINYSSNRISFNRTLSATNSDIAPLIIIDGMRMNAGPDDMIGALDALQMLSLSDVAQIDVLKDLSKLSIYGPTAYGGVIEIFTKKGDGIPDKLKFNTKITNPLGYHIPVEFYSPRYDTPEARNLQTPDLRSTIYWKPDVVVNKDGKVAIDFYTADTPSSYSVIIEGVNSEGELIYYRENAVVNSTDSIMSIAP